MSVLICDDAMAGRLMWGVTLWFNKGRLVLVVDKKKNKKQEYKNVAHYSQASLDVMSHGVTMV